MDVVTTLDSAGRLVLPKAMRDSLGLLPGAKIRMGLSGDGVRITREVEELAIRKKGRRRVITGGEPFDAAEAVRAARRAGMERFGKNAGA